MKRTCVRCGADNNEATGSATETCPQCGVVYSKAAIAAAQKSVLSETRQRIDASRPGTPSVVERICWVLVLLSSGAGVFELIHTIRFAESAPQQGAGAAMAVGLAVIPYCIARAVQLSMRRS